MNCQLYRDWAAAIHAVSLSRVQAAHAHLPVLTIINMFAQIMYWNWINIISWDIIFYLKSLKAGSKLLLRTYLSILNMFAQIIYWNWINIIFWDTIFYLKSLKAGFKLLMRNCKSYPVSICLHRLCNWVILTFLLPTFTTSYIFFKFPFYKIYP